MLAYGEEKLYSAVATIKGHVGKGHGHPPVWLVIKVHTRGLFRRAQRLRYPRKEDRRNFAETTILASMTANNDFYRLNWKITSFGAGASVETTLGAHRYLQIYTGSATKTGIVLDVRPWYSS